jgi:hypothetical protein
VFYFRSILFRRTAAINQRINQNWALASTMSAYPSALQVAEYCGGQQGGLLQFDISGLQEAFSENAEAMRRIIQVAGAEPALEDGALVNEIRSYLMSLAPVWAPVLTFALLAAACWMPVFFARCCAHRCCAPREHAQPFCGLLNWVAFLILSLALVGCAVTGVVAANDANAAVDSMSCGFAGVVQDVYFLFDGVQQKAVLLRQALGNASTALVQVTESSECVADNLPAAGAICDRVARGLGRVEEVRLGPRDLREPASRKQVAVNK